MASFSSCLPQNEWYSSYSYSNGPSLQRCLPPPQTKQEKKNYNPRYAYPKTPSKLATAFEITHHTFTAAADKPIIFARLSPGDALRAFERVSAATAVAARVRCSYCAAERRTLQQNRIITQGFHLF